MWYSSNVHDIWITAGEATICQTIWYICLVSNKAPKTISCPLWKILSYSDLQWMLLELMNPVAQINRFLKNREFYLSTSSLSIWYAWIIHVFFVFQLVQIIPMARTVGKDVDIVHRMVRVTREVVYVQMTVTAPIGPHSARSVSTLCMLKQLWKTDICNFRMHSVPSSINWYSRVIRRQINDNSVNMHIPYEGTFLSCELSYFSNIIL